MGNCGDYFLSIFLNWAYSKHKILQEQGLLIWILNKIIANFYQAVTAQTDETVHEILFFGLTIAFIS